MIFFLTEFSFPLLYLPTPRSSLPPPTPIHPAACLPSLHSSPPPHPFHGLHSLPLSPLQSSNSHHFPLFPSQSPRSPPFTYLPFTILLLTGPIPASLSSQPSIKPHLILSPSFLSDSLLPPVSSTPLPFSPQSAHIPNSLSIPHNSSIVPNLSFPSFTSLRRPLFSLPSPSLPIPPLQAAVGQPETGRLTFPEIQLQKPEK